MLLWVIISFLQRCPMGSFFKERSPLYNLLVSLLSSHTSVCSFPESLSCFCCGFLLVQFTTTLWTGVCICGYVQQICFKSYLAIWDTFNEKCKWGLSWHLFFKFCPPPTQPHRLSFCVSVFPILSVNTSFLHLQLSYSVVFLPYICLPPLHTHFSSDCPHRFTTQMHLLWFFPFTHTHSLSLTLTLHLFRSLSCSLSLSLSVSLAHAHAVFHSNLTLLSINMCFVRPCRLCSATLVDLQLLSNTYCQASETCNLSFARRRPTNSTRYINKKNDCCYACQEPVCVRVCACV